MKNMPVRIFSRALAVLILLFVLPGCTIKAKPPSAIPAFSIEEALAQADILFAQGNYEETILALDTIIEVDPTDTRSYLRLADVYLARGDEQRALKLLQEGYDNTGDKDILQRIQGLTQPLAVMKSVSMGDTFSLFVSQEGDVYCSGDFFQAKEPWEPSKEVLFSNAYPVKIEGLSNIEKVYTGVMGNGCAAIAENGELYIWNTAYFPDGHRDKAISTPQKVLDNVVDIACGIDFVLVLQTEGDLYSWGNNYFGQLGRNLPHDEGGVINDERYLFSLGKVRDDVQQIYANYFGAAVVTEDNALYCWGIFLENRSEENVPHKATEGISALFCANPPFGEVYLADMQGHLHECINLWAVSSPGFSLEECQVSSIPLVRDVTGSDGSAFLIDIKGDVYAKSDNKNGELGIVPSSEPASLLDWFPVLIGQDIMELSVCNGAVAAVSRDGRVMTWGNNQNGQLGNGRKGSQRNSEQPSLVITSVRQVAGGALADFYAIKEDGALFHWGKEAEGGCNPMPVKLLDNIRSVSIAPNSKNDLEEPYAPGTMLAITNDDEFLFFNTNENRSFVDLCFLTYDTTQHEDGQIQLYLSGRHVGTIKEVPDSTFEFKKEKYTINNAIFGYSNCFIINKNSTAWGWGVNDYGQLGGGAPHVSGYDPNKNYADQPLELMKGIKDIAASRTFTCLLTDTGDVFFCGLSRSESSSVPVKIADNIQQIAATPFSCLFLSEQGELLAYNFYRPGHGNMPQIANQVIYMDVQADGSVIYVDKQGIVCEWKDSTSDGEFEQKEVAQLDNAIQAAATTGPQGERSYLILNADGKLYSMGDNTYGQLGLGDAGTDENIFEIIL